MKILNKVRKQLGVRTNNQTMYLPIGGANKGLAYLRLEAKNTAGIRSDG